MDPLDELEECVFKLQKEEEWVKVCRLGLCTIGDLKMDLIPHWEKRLKAADSDDLSSERDQMRYDELVAELNEWKEKNPVVWELWERAEALLLKIGDVAALKGCRSRMHTPIRFEQACRFVKERKLERLEHRVEALEKYLKRKYEDVEVDKKP